MDHDDVLEQLELAAVEPGGLDRLVAGDTPMAAAVAAHLAGCDRCAEELRRLSRAAPLLRDLVRTTPPPELRERTLAYVKAHGRERGDRAPVASHGVLEAAGAPVAGSSASQRPTAAKRSARGILPWAATIAAVVALIFSGASYLANRDLADRLSAQATSISALERVQTATLEVTADPAARRVELASTGGSETNGTLLFSPSTARLVVVAYDLQRPASGQEYRCWVEIGGQRRSVGRMFFADELAFWVGDTPEVRDLPAGTVFGVSPTAIGSPSLEADPVIRGEL
ncbi:MAG TPA: anti-sigma factor [Candidatus Limnocylindrales bacterium]|nr:anti-sigma factor [Candidatus Limnocylindrales bacterium]